MREGRWTCRTSECKGKWWMAICESVTRLLIGWPTLSRDKGRANSGATLVAPRWDDVATWASHKNREHAVAPGWLLRCHVVPYVSQLWNAWQTVFGEFDALFNCVHPLNKREKKNSAHKGVIQGFSSAMASTISQSNQSSTSTIFSACLTATRSLRIITWESVERKTNNVFACATRNEGMLGGQLYSRRMFLLFILLQLYWVSTLKKIVGFTS